MFGKEVSLKGETEQSLYSDFDCARNDSIKNHVADSLLTQTLADCHGAHFSEIFPKDVEGTTTNNFTIYLCNSKFLDIFIEGNCLFREQPTLQRVLIDHLANCLDVGGLCWANYWIHSGFTRGKRMVSRIPKPVSAMSNRSTPIPIPAVGGMPTSSARKKSSSRAIASKSPLAPS